MQEISPVHLESDNLGWKNPKFIDIIYTIKLKKLKIF
jgi:hypothetical protein